MAEIATCRCAFGLFYCPRDANLFKECPGANLDSPSASHFYSAGRRLSVGRSKAYEWANDGTIPTVTIGGLRRVPIRLLEDRIRSLTGGSTPAL